MADDIEITSLRGGQDDTDLPSALAEDQCQLAQNVEFFSSALGERRAGCDPYDLTSSGLNLGAGSVLVHLNQWLPTNDVLSPEFWAISAIPGTSVAVARKPTGSAWTTVSPVDGILNTAPDIYNIQSQALNGEFFFAYHDSGGTDRLHVWDPVATSLRAVGLLQPGMPSVADTAVAGTYAGVRYFRTREVVEVAGSVTLRSEPSVVNQFTPNGSFDGAVITRNAQINPNSTHWEVEASTDNAFFYRIATVVIGTTTYTDHTAFATGYAAGNTLSEAIGAYLVPRAARFLAVDGDRLLMGGHWFDPTAQSTVSWTPVANDPGVGNDERLPISTTGGLPITSSINLDNYAGGPLTGITSGVNGVWYAFKWDHIYQMTRTDDVTRPYAVITLSTSRGAVPGSIFSGMDENGSPCIYFLDPMMGPSRLGAGGLQLIVGLRGTWNRANLHAQKVKACGCYYPFKQQAWFWVALDGSDNPSIILKLQVSEVRPLDPSHGMNAVGRGWSVATGRIANAYCASVFTENLAFPTNGVFSLSERPFIGLTYPDFIQRCDVDTTDAGVPYSAVIITSARFVSSLLQKWGGITGTLLATAQAGQTIFVRFIRDFGVETSKAVTASLSPAGSESLVIRDFDNLALIDARALQVQFSDS